MSPRIEKIREKDNSNEIVGKINVGRMFSQKHHYAFELRKKMKYFEEKKDRKHDKQSKPKNPPEPPRV